MPTPLFNMTSFNTTTAERVPPVDPARAHVEALEVAGKAVEKQMTLDSSFPFLKDRMRITQQSEYCSILLVGYYFLIKAIGTIVIVQQLDFEFLVEVSVWGKSLAIKVIFRKCL